MPADPQRGGAPDAQGEIRGQGVVRQAADAVGAEQGAGQRRPS
ncbi:MAG: hypothetical protein ACO3KD_02810 [Gaiellales bacterium]